MSILNSIPKSRVDRKSGTDGIRFLASLALLGSLLAFGSCGSTANTGGPSGGSDDPIAHLYAKSTTQIDIEVDYQRGAEPYTGMILTMDTWNLFIANVNRLFQGSGKTLKVPTTIDKMEMLSDISGQNFTTQQLLDIATLHRQQRDTETTTSFYFVFLDGYFNDGKMVRMDVLGVSLGKTGVIAMFKPVIASTSSLANIRKFVEQSTLIHEFGHAIGLVNNGVAMAASHQDTANGAHCNNDRCTMYYANEGAAAAVMFASKYIQTGEEILFDASCLADVAARVSSAQ
jgi:predicted Zn-dependent protease